MDIAILNTLQIGMGRLREMDGVVLSRLELGLHLGNHLEFGMSWIEAGDGLMDSQKSFKLGLHHLLEWSRKDWTWWRE